MLVAIVISMKRKSVLVLIIVLSICWAGCSPAQASPQKAVAPVLGDVVRTFDAPDPNWKAGHRGVDIASAAGQVVVAAMDGVVSFAGVVVDRGVISVFHGDLTTTYEPVEAVVHTGDYVHAGDPIGILALGHLCPQDACLHWGLKRGEVYFNPLTLLGGGQVRLINASQMDRVRAAAAAMREGMSAAGLISPTTGVITDVYGMRLHPVDGIWRFHDGLDIGAPCGTPIVAVRDGKVTESSSNTGYGNRLIIDHGDTLVGKLTTSYNHAQSWVVGIGDQVIQGQLIGYIGSTGVSTGCHLHFQTWVNGELVDPQPLLN